MVGVAIDIECPVAVVLISSPLDFVLIKNQKLPDYVMCSEQNSNQRRSGLKLVLLEMSIRRSDVDVWSDVCVVKFPWSAFENQI
mmetsp:Transcript_39201/g.94802  ORF Transcript_39201/g.94802 Transcript_39201/m.94802 type:complete len:84 (-) Transcript_39201:510-761(-)